MTSKTGAYLGDLTTTVSAPAEADRRVDRINDVDAHEMIPVHLWDDVFGEGGKALQCLATTRYGSESSSVLRDDEVSSDTMEISDESVWSVRSVRSPSAIDLGRRESVLDVMGVQRQLIYPTFGLAGLLIKYHPDAGTYVGYDSATVDSSALGNKIIHSHNEWAIEMVRTLNTERVRPVGIVLTDTLPQMIADAEGLIEGGVRCIQIPNGVPPAGMSPADTELDSFWAMLASSNIPVTTHIGTEFPLLASPQWGANVPQFAAADISNLEFPIQPYWGATLNLASDNFITAMVLGGVFERHPNLRFGALEVGAQWIGPLAERLDMWAELFATKLSGYLSLRPSEFINRNIRVSPFYFEDVAGYFDRYQQLGNTYCYSSDYPHPEGGKWSKKLLADKLSGCPDEVARAFFYGNSELLLP